MSHGHRQYTDANGRRPSAAKFRSTKLSKQLTPSLSHPASFNDGAQRQLFGLKQLDQHFHAVHAGRLCRQYLPLTEWRGVAKTNGGVLFFMASNSSHRRMRHNQDTAYFFRCHQPAGNFKLTWLWAVGTSRVTDRSARDAATSSCVPAIEGGESPTGESFSESFVLVGERDGVFFWGWAVRIGCSRTGGPCSGAGVPTSASLPADAVGSLAGRSTANALQTQTVFTRVARCHEVKLRRK